jgi:hypothetical protein
MAEGFTVLETSPLVMTICLLFVVVASLFLERGLHRLHHYLAHQYRWGSSSCAGATNRVRSGRALTASSPVALPQDGHAHGAG